MNLKVLRIMEETHDTKTLFLVDAEEGGRPFDYLAGQYLTFRFDHLAEKPFVRSYTLSSSPCETDYSAVTVKKLDMGLASTYLCSLREGDCLRARGPMGGFVYEAHKHKPHLFMIGAGSGVTPFVSILREYHDKLGQAHAPKSMTLLVSYRTQQDLILWQDLQKLKAHSPSLHIFTTLSREPESEQFWSGRISPAVLQRATEHLGMKSYSDTTFMLCGPVEMMDSIKSQLSKELPPEQIRTESFDS
ncbi:MAG: hypothetical protein KA436_09400 [Oligoflexales bacterium]|nr:hypothetical protein [Oligoflexales bacterium]